MIVTRTPGSSSLRRRQSMISPRSALFSALRFSGRFRVMRRTYGAGSSTTMTV
jgi:hypothetical protein